MTGHERFEDLPVWQAAADLYGFAENLLSQQDLGVSPGWRDQFDRATLAVSSQIARGSERGTTSEERTAAVGQARAALAEVRSMLRMLERRKVSREALVPVARLKALAESCATQLRAYVESMQEPAAPTLPKITARPPEMRPPQAASRAPQENIRHRTVEIARKILGILPNHQR